MSNANKNNYGVENIFVPMIEGITELFTKGVEIGTKSLAEYIQNGFKKTEKENVYQKLNIRMLADKKQVHDEKFLGWAINYERPFSLDKLDTTKHVFLVGASGWGKTNLLNILMDNALKKDQAIICVDAKGTLEALNDFKKLCKFHNRDYAIFSEFDVEAQSFNPIADMTNTQRVEMIMRSFDWGANPVRFYLDQASVALQTALETLTKDDPKADIDLHDLYRELKAKHNNENTSGLINQFDRLLKSDFGKCFKSGLKEGTRSMTLKEAHRTKKCIYIGCSTQGYAQIARTIGKMFVSEAMNLSYTIGRESSDSHKNMKNSIALFIDEAGSVLFPDFIDLVNKCRASGINIFLAIQSYSDMEMVGGGETFMKQLFESFSTWFIQRQTNPENAEKLAAAFGTYLSQKITTATEQGGDAGRGTIREGYEYYCHPDILKSINVGQTVYLSHSPKEITIINVRNFRNSAASRLDVENKREEKNENQLNQKIETPKKKLKGAMNV